MTKKEFERESYLAPEWGMRVIMVERHILEPSPGNPGDDDDYNDPNNGDDY